MMKAVDIYSAFRCDAVAPDQEVYSDHNTRSSRNV